MEETFGRIPAGAPLPARDYPTEPVVDAVRTANEYGLIDLGRIERMVLRRLAGEFFRLPPDTNDEDDDA